MSRMESPASLGHSSNSGSPNGSPLSHGYSQEQIADAILRLDDRFFVTGYGLTAHDTANMLRAKLAIALPASLRAELPGRQRVEAGSSGEYSFSC